MSIFEKHKDSIQKAIKANHERTFYAHYPEHPKAYDESLAQKAEEEFKSFLNSKFDRLLQSGTSGEAGSEESPFTQQLLGIKYPTTKVETLIENAAREYENWRKVSPQERAGILVDALEKAKTRFFEIAHATQHTTGQSFMMSFQASGPHANDRAFEALSMGYYEQTRFPDKIDWEKPMGKFNVHLKKWWKVVPRGISLAIGCSTFPVWNTVPGIFASLVTGNPVIVKPHPGSVLPIAIVIAEIQKALTENSHSADIIQLAVDTHDKPVTKELAGHEQVKLIDYTGGNQFGDYIESLKGKITFTEKAGVNSVIMDSVKDLNAVMQNLAFSVSLYSGQMCTAPQNFFIPKDGIKADDKHYSYEEVVDNLVKNISGLANHPKMGAGTLGAIQNKNTKERVEKAKTLGAKILLEPQTIENSEFPKARTCAPMVLEVDSSQKDIYFDELFGPVIVVIKTNDTAHSVELARELTAQKGAITCAAYTTDSSTKDLIETKMESVFVSVSFNLTGMIWVNQNAAFSDFHVSGGNNSGNASITDVSFVVKRFVWMGHKEVG